MKLIKIFLLSSLLFILISANVIRPVVSDNILKYDQFQQTALNDSAITLLNWNIHKKVNCSKWLRDFTSLLEKHTPDIIALQEAKSNDIFREVLGKKKGYIFAANVSNSKGINSGVLTASGANPVHYKHSLSQDLEPLLNTPKIVLSTKYRLLPSNKTLQVINVHGINFVNSSKFHNQMSEIEKQIKKHIGPVLLVGDFNTWKKKRLEILTKLIKRQNLKSVDFNPSDSIHIKHFMNSPLDHIFYSDDLELHQNSFDVVEQISSSDHKPLLATFSVKR